jgi:drug/metabolite transporter (DMT)-like permease
MIPIFTIVFETLLIRHESFRWTLWLSIALGFCGVAVLMLHGGESGLHLLPCLVILCGSMSWCLGSVLSRKLALPQSKPLISGSEMLLGGILLLLSSSVAGELHPLPHFTKSSVLALLYLIIFGSLLAYTAYVWLLSHMTATRVASYAYVNPVVAVAIGHWLGGEPLSGRTILGTGLVLVSVLVTLRSQSTTKKTTNPVAETAKGDAT